MTGQKTLWLFQGQKRAKLLKPVARLDFRVAIEICSWLFVALP
jgi:hypothetical protein